MKKVSLILNIVLTVAVIALFVLFFTYNPHSCKGEESIEATGETAHKGDIVYIQLDTLINQYDMFNDLRSELESKLNTIQNDLNKKGRAFENDVKDFEDKYSKGLITRSQAESMQNSLMTRENELKNYSQQKQVEMAEEENVMINRVMDAIKSYVTKYNEVHQYSLIITTTNSTNTVLEGNAPLNVTQDILNGLNQEYIKNRNSKKK